MKKVILILNVAGLLVLYTSCSNNDPKAVLGNFLNILENNYMKMEKVKSPDDVIATFNQTADKMRSMIPLMNKLTEKYPEIKNLQNGTRLPEELSEFELRFAELGQKQIRAIGHAGIFMKDQKVLEARENFIKVMNEMISYREIEYIDNGL
jgi:hypothetical protein